MSKPEQCPFCGYKDVEIVTDENEYLYYRYFLQCQRCGPVQGQATRKKTLLTNGIGDINMNKIENTTNYPMDSHDKFCRGALVIMEVSVLKLAVNLQRNVISKQPTAQAVVNKIYLKEKEQ